MQKNILKIRIILWLILAVVTGWLVFLKIVPSGKISYVFNFYQPSYFIGKLAPQARAELDIVKGQAEIKGDPVYFSLRPSRRFEKAKVTVKFKNTTDLPVMELGILNDKVAWGYDLRPLQNKIIDQIALVWPEVKGQNGSRLIEREKKYQTVEQFIGNLPDSRQLANEVALYDYNLKVKFLLNDYEPQALERMFDYSLRGSYQFYTYIKNENLAYVFNFIDLNENKDSDPVDIKIYSPDGLIYSKNIADGAGVGSARQASIKISGLPEAVYRFSFIANDDIITKAIISPQSRLAFINRLWLAAGNKKDLALYTNGRSVSAQTVNPASLGKIKVGESLIDLSETYRQFFVKTSSQGAEIILPKDDIIISGDGVFSFSMDSLLDPRFKNIDRNFDINQENISYVLTNYQPPAENNGWQTAAADFDLTKAYRESGKYQFMISVPGLSQNESSPGEIIIKEIKIDLSGTSLRRKINKFFSNHENAD